MAALKIVRIGLVDGWLGRVFPVTYRRRVLQWLYVRSWAIGRGIRARVGS